MLHHQRLPEGAGATPAPLLDTLELTHGQRNTLTLRPRKELRKEMKKDTAFSLFFLSLGLSGRHRAAVTFSSYSECKITNSMPQ